ncbi:SDR family NAD(P)-dependent oxidoreductase, partial [Halomonas sp. BBD48]|nr:SDR family NAD(P)-dependent oxidoreductase [Halomonas sp. BBD48]
MPLFSLEGRVAMVTGCNRGLGQAMAVALAEAGADIVGVSRREADQTRQRVEALGRRY